MVNAWLSIAPDETILLTIGSSEMGQGSSSGLAQIIAEDLMVDYAAVEIVQGAPTLATPAPVGTAINTVGSSVTRNNFWALRDAAAVAREMLVSAAMTAIGDPVRANYDVSHGVIKNRVTLATRTYGQVAGAAALLTPPASAPLVPDASFRIIGKTMPRLDLPDKVEGRAIYGLDIRLPNMVYGVVRHSPTLGGTLAKVPAVPASMIAVVPTKVVAGTARGLEAVDNVNAIVVVGDNTWDAWQASKSLSVSWNLPAGSTALNDAKFLSDAQGLAEAASPYVAGGLNPPGTLYTVEGDSAATKTALTQSTRTLDATYRLPYVSHACMEVLNCTVDFVPGVKCDLYVPTQSAKSVLSLAVSLTGLPASQVKVHTTYLGGGAVGKPSWIL